jgi:hypothetical protein
MNRAQFGRRCRAVRGFAPRPLRAEDRAAPRPGVGFNEKALNARVQRLFSRFRMVGRTRSAGANVLAAHLASPDRPRRKRLRPGSNPGRARSIRETIRAGVRGTAEAEHRIVHIPLIAGATGAWTSTDHSWGRRGCRHRSHRLWPTAHEPETRAAGPLIEDRELN